MSLRQAQDRLFAEAAGRLAGLAGVHFGWRPGEFWAATPAELAALADVLTGDEQALPPDPALIAKLREAHPDG